MTNSPSTNALTLPLIETKISESFIRMRCADDADAAVATQWLDFQVRLDGLIDPFDKARPLGDAERQYLGATHLAALLRMQSAVNTEIQRLRAVARQTF